MSDYFTNLVTRSFSPVASVQPLGVSPYVAPEEAENSFEESSDPFAEAAKLDNDMVNAEAVSPERKPSRSKPPQRSRSEEHTSELQSHLNLVCRLLLEKKKKKKQQK